MNEENPIFENPHTMKDAIGKKVIIKTVDNRIHEGFIYVIDPISKTVVLTNETGSSVDLILHHGISKIDVIEGIKKVFTYPPKSTTAVNVEEKKQTLKKWLIDNHVDVIEDGEMLKIGDHITIEPPYSINQCYCSNTVILERIQSIIKRMPTSKQ